MFVGTKKICFFSHNFIIIKVSFLNKKRSIRKNTKNGFISFQNIENEYTTDRDNKNSFFWGGEKMSFSQWFYETKGHKWEVINLQGVPSELRSSLYAEYETYCDSQSVKPVFGS